MAHPPVIPSAKEFYDTLMRTIEADLTTDQLPLLDAKYQGESSEDRKKRMTRYFLAFQKFERQKTIRMKDLTSQMIAVSKEVFKEAEQQSHSEDRVMLSELDSAISS